MKKAMLFFAFFVAIIAKAQTTDSTSLKLEQYKMWHDNKTISDDDYAKLKAKLLGIESPTTSLVVKNNVDYSKYKNYKVEWIAGAVCTGTGLITLIGVEADRGIIYNKIVHNVANGNAPSASDVQNQLHNLKKVEWIAGGIGAASAITGVVLLLVADRHETLYKSQTVSLNLDTHTNGLGLAMNF